MQTIQKLKENFFFYFFFSFGRIQEVKNQLMLRVFGRKIFFEKYFLYFSMFSATENDYQRKSFQFDHKSLFNFRKTIYDFKNRKSLCNETPYNVETIQPKLYKER
jgi:hypothetical protein